MLTHGSLFSGVGGIDLAAEWAGFETVFQVEIDPYCTKILEKHWPEVPRWRDIRDVTLDSYRERSDMGTITVISGGFPCQPFSVAGNQKGRDDDRYLWPEMRRVIREFAPRWVVAENVPGIMRIAADEVCQDLEQAGYDVGIFSFEAAAVGALHRRERIFFVANTRSWRLSEQDVRSQQPGRAEAISASETISDAEHNGRITTETSRNIGTGSDNNTSRSTTTGKLEGRSDECSLVANTTSVYGQRRFDGSGETQPWGSGWWSTEPNVGRVANGISEKFYGLGGMNNDKRFSEKSVSTYFPCTRMCKVWQDGRETGTASSGYRKQTVGNYCPLSEVPFIRGQAFRQAKNEEPKRMRDMRKAIFAISQQEEQDLRERVFECARKNERVQKMASLEKRDRLKCLGNAVVPQQIYPIFKAIAEIEQEQDQPR